jgi:hypothetical protein
MSAIVAVLYRFKLYVVVHVYLWYNEPMNKITYLGKPCRKNHLVDETSLTLRYVSNRKCVECMRQLHADYYLRNQDAIKAKVSDWRASNLEHVQKYDAEYYQQNREIILNRNRRYRKANPEARKLSDSAYRTRNRERLREKDVLRRQTNAQSIKASRDKYRQNHPERIRLADAARVAANPKVRLNKNISVRIRQSLSAGKEGRTWEAIVGFSLADLISHIEQQFTPEMTWENYGSFWHIDHIKPLAAFTYTSFTDLAFHEAWALSNLRPLQAIENLRKGAKFPTPEPPPLE